MKLSAYLILASTCILSRPLPAASNWSIDGSALLFTKGDAAGGAFGAGYRAGSHYVGADILFHNFSQTSAPGFGAGTLRMVAPGLLYKYFLPPLDNLRKAEVFLGGCLASARINADVGTATDNLATQLLAGIQIPLGKGALKLGWRYLDVKHVNVLAGDQGVFKSHAFEAGFNFRF